RRTAESPPATAPGRPTAPTARARSPGRLGAIDASRPLLLIARRARSDHAGRLVAGERDVDLVAAVVHQRHIEELVPLAVGALAPDRGLRQSARLAEIGAHLVLLADPHAVARAPVLAGVLGRVEVLPENMRQHLAAGGRPGRDAGRQGGDAVLEVGIFEDREVVEVEP